MSSKFSHRGSTFVRALSAVSLFVLAGLLIGGPMGCGSATDTTPLPVDDGTDTGTGTGGGGITDPNGDALPITSIQYWDAQTDPTGWTVRTDLNFKIDSISPDVPAPTICWSWNLPSNWPNRNGKSVGNNWIIAKVDGAWHATPWEHVKASDTSCRTTEALSGQPPFIQGYGAIAASWWPKSGDEVYWMNSTIARGDRDPGTPDERTPIVRFDWP